LGEFKYNVPPSTKTEVTAKKTLRASQAKSERVQNLRVEYWSKVAQVAQVALENLVFIDEMGVLLGLMRIHGRSEPGERASL
jgi:hypothetical protein